MATFRVVISAIPVAEEFLFARLGQVRLEFRLLILRESRLVVQLTCQVNRALLILVVWPSHGRNLVVNLVCFLIQLLIVKGTNRLDVALMGHLRLVVLDGLYHTMVLRVIVVGKRVDLRLDVRLDRWVLLLPLIVFTDGCSTKLIRFNHLCLRVLSGLVRYLDHRRKLLLEKVRFSTRRRL